MDSNVLAIKIKKIMKTQKLKYSDLATHLDMSESGVKKLLAGKDFSMNKLTQIAEFLSLSLVDLIESSKDQEFVEHKLNTEIESFFVNNWDHFCFYWLLVAEVTPLEEILEMFQLDYSDVEPFLLKLDSFNLIEFHSREKIIINEENSFTWGKDGALVKKILQTFPPALLKDSTENNGVDGKKMGLFSVRMSNKTMDDFERDLKALFQEYTERGVYDINSGKKDIVNFAITYAFSPHSLFKRGDFFN